MGGGCEGSVLLQAGVGVGVGGVRGEGEAPVYSTYSLLIISSTLHFSLPYTHTHTHTQARILTLLLLVR